MTVILDIFFITGRYSESSRLSLALVAFALTVYLFEGDLKALGLQARPIQGWKVWVRTSLIIGLIIGFCICLGGGLWYLTGHQVPFHLIHPQDFNSAFMHLCFVAPVLEEAIYRLVICVSLNRLMGEWKTIAISGILFAVLHILYGNPSPENQLGGFFLAWAFLKSETILLPFLLHSVGNFLVLTGKIAFWYFLKMF